MHERVFNLYIQAIPQKYLCQCPEIISSPKYLRLQTVEKELFIDFRLEFTTDPFAHRPSFYLHNATSFLLHWVHFTAYDKIYVESGQA